MDGRSAATDIECLWTNMEIWVGTTHLVFCTIRTLFIEMYKSLKVQGVWHAVNTLVHDQAFHITT
jgi:hypothetical protein